MKFRTNSEKFAEIGCIFAAKNKIPGRIWKNREEEMTEPIRWPNVHQHLRDDAAELVRGVVARLEVVTMNQVNGEEEIEAICAETISDLNVLLRALEKAGATTNPLYELKNRADSLSALLIPERV